MEAFAVGQIIANKTGNDEYAIVDVTDKLIAVRKRSSGMDIVWWEKDKVKGQIAMGVFQIKE